MRAVRIVVVGAVLALLGLLVWDVAHSNGPGVAQKVDKGKIVPAPNLDLPRLDAAGRLSLASLRGKVSVVNFWESYCTGGYHQGFFHLTTMWKVPSGVG